MSDEKQLTYEQARDQLVEVVRQLESGNVPLSTSMELCITTDLRSSRSKTNLACTVPTSSESGSQSLSKSASNTSP